MSAASEVATSVERLGWWGWLRQELAPYPGREIRMLRMVVATVLVVGISMALMGGRGKDV